MKKLKVITSAILAAAIAVSSSAVFSAAAKAPTPTLKNKLATILVTWKGTKGAKYTLAAKAPGKSFKVIYTGKKTAYSYNTAKAGKKYSFKLKVNGGKYGKTVSIVYLKRVRSLTAAEPLSMEGIKLKWKKIPGAKSYNIYRSPKRQNKFKKIASTTKKSYLDKDVKSIEVYKYYVVAVNGKSKSQRSNEASEIYGFLNNYDDTLYLTIKKGEVFREIYEKLNKNFIAGSFTWKSYNKSIAKVNFAGVITGVKKGTAKITAHVDKDALGNKNAHTLTIMVKVK